MDPRNRVTRTAFEIHPPLMDVALASPRRRAAALLVDLSLAGIVSAFGGGFVVGLIAAALFFHLVRRTASASRMRRAFRTSVASLGAIVVFVLGLLLGGTADVHVEVRDDLTYEDSVEVARGLEEVAEELSEFSIGPGIKLPSTVTAALPDFQPVRREGPISPEVRAERAVYLRRYVDAYAAADSAVVDSLQEQVADIVAQPRIRRAENRAARLDARVDVLEEENARLSAELESPSLVRSVRALASDFGLTFGWVGIYFTLLLTTFNGYTPGKRLLGIRVCRLDGGRITPWTAFERFGGYAAGVATGMVGFAQVLWDANRQGVQDKIAGTVVVRMEDAQTMHRLNLADTETA